MNVLKDLCSPRITFNQSSDDRHPRVFVEMKLPDRHENVCALLQPLTADANYLLGFFVLSWHLS